MPKKLLLDVSDELWERFKEIPRPEKNLNEAVVDLIRKTVTERDVLDMPLAMKHLQTLSDEYDTDLEELRQRYIAIYSDPFVQSLGDRDHRRNLSLNALKLQLSYEQMQK